MIAVVRHLASISRLSGISETGRTQVDEERPSPPTRTLLPGLFNVPSRQQLFEGIALCCDTPYVNLKLVRCQSLLGKPRFAHEAISLCNTETNELRHPVAEPGLQRDVLQLPNHRSSCNDALDF